MEDGERYALDERVRGWCLQTPHGLAISVLVDCTIQGRVKSLYLSKTF